MDHSANPGTCRGLLLCGLLLTVLIAGDAFGQPNNADASQGAQASATTQPRASRPADAPLRGPKYNVLRWREDYSYLDGPPGSYREDHFDPIRNIRIGDEWRINFGGSLRGRWESRNNQFINQVDPTHDATLLHRYFLHADVQYEDWFRFYAEGIFAAIEDNHNPPLAINENRGDFYQHFIDLRAPIEDGTLTFRAGRQELLYGKQRFISPLDWSNTRRRFDGFKLFWESQDWNADLFYVFPVRTWRSRADQFDSKRPQIGAYVTYKGIENHGIDFYYIYSRNGRDLTNADGDPGSQNLNTIGGRFWGKAGPWDYDTELTGQFGSFAGDSIQAWAWAAEAGYTFRELDWSPRIGLGFDHASGDASPSDSYHQTFDQLFPLGHAYLGYIDLVARQNVIAGNVNLTFRPVETVSVRLAHNAFWLAENSDGLFNAGGALLRRDPLGNAPHDVGQEFDLTINWKVDDHSSVLFGYSHLWNGGFINETGLGDDPDFVYLQYVVRF